jgi:hypothetical protein
MFIIDITLKNTPINLSVQRKEQEEAEAVYRQVVETLNSGSNKVLELTCEYQVGKKISLLSSEVCAVQVYEKSSTATYSGRAPGFAAMVE